MAELGWTFETLLHYVEARIDDADRRYEQRFQAQEAATLYTRQITNEFRGTLSDQAERLMPRVEAIARADQNAEKIVALEGRLVEGLGQVNSRLDLTTGRSTGLDAGWKYLIAAAGLAATLIGIILAFR